MWAVLTVVFALIRHDAAGQSAWQLIMQVIGKLLDPSDTNENGGLVLGGLVLALLRKAGTQISGNLPELIQAMVVRLASAKTLSLAQSLILPIAHLMCEQCETVVQVLKQVSVPAAEGAATGDGLTVFARRWVEETTTIHGAWAKKAK
jgi:importin-9